MRNVTVFDPAMCCSTGVCGPAPDKELIRFSADLRALEARGVQIVRYNLAQQPAAFLRNANVKELLTTKGADVLPIIEVDGQIWLQGRYPTTDELAGLSAEERGEAHA